MLFAPAVAVAMLAPRKSGRLEKRKAAAPAPASSPLARTACAPPPKLQRLSEVGALSRTEVRRQFEEAKGERPLSLEGIEPGESRRTLEAIQAHGRSVRMMSNVRSDCWREMVEFAADVDELLLRKFAHFKEEGLCGTKEEFFRLCGTTSKAHYKRVRLGAVPELQVLAILGFLQLDFLDWSLKVFFRHKDRHVAPTGLDLLPPPDDDIIWYWTGKPCDGTRDALGPKELQNFLDAYKSRRNEVCCGACLSSQSTHTSPNGAPTSNTAHSPAHQH